MRGKKPFYLRDPWDILFNDNKLQKTSPWNVDLVFLLTTLLEEMNREGIDFRLAGTAINSSVYIFLKKAENLLKIRDHQEEAEKRNDAYVPPPIPLPFRFEFTTTSISDLIVALEKALSEETRKKPKPKLPVLPIPITDLFKTDAYLLKIQERAKILLQEIEKIGDAPISILKLTESKSFFDVVRTFLILLFLAQEGNIDLLQDENEEDIKIKIKEG
jgi:chromatin segregation and condensation protein Rec8/ScpA/Scc1 (kleisin family)